MIAFAPNVRAGHMAMQDSDVHPAEPLLFKSQRWLFRRYAPYLRRETWFEELRDLWLNRDRSNFGNTTRRVLDSEGLPLSLKPTSRWLSSELGEP